MTFLTFSDDGSRIAGACNDGKVLVWDTDNGRMVICVQGESETESVTFLHGESVIAAVWNDGRVFVVDIDENRNLSTFKVPGEVEYAAFSTEGHQLICGSWNSLCIWDLRVGREVWRIPLEGTPLMALALSRYGHTIVICDQNGIVNTWDSEIGQEIGWFKPMMEEWDVPQVCFSWDGKRIVVGSQSSGDVYILDVRGGEMPRSLYGTTYSSLYPISHLSFAPDGCQFASATTNGLVHIWDASTGEHIRCLSGHHDLMRSIVFTSDSRRLITGSWDKTVRLWQIESGEVLQSFDSSSRFCISPDDRHIVVAQELGSLIQVFNTDNREEHCRLNGLLGNAFSMAYSTDSGHIAAGGLMGSICVWDADSGQREFFFIFESLYAVRCITFSRNGRFLANGCDDGKIHLWDLGTREEVRCFEGHQDEVDLLMFSQDGGRIISQSSNFETRIWDVETSRCLEVINGQTDINALAAGSILQPYRVIAQDGETIIYLADTGDTVGWWPDALSSLAAHQSGLVWIGASGKYITLIKFEGES